MSDGGWTKVEDCLPRRGERVLVGWVGHPATTGAWHNADGWVGWSWVDADHQTPPTHWRPLPPGPRL